MNDRGDIGDTGESAVTTSGALWAMMESLLSFRVWASDREDELVSVVEAEKRGLTASRSGFRGGGTRVVMLLLTLSSTFMMSVNSGSLRKAGWML